MNITEIIIIYLAVINVATFFTFGIDKLKAKHAKWRIREAALLTLAVLGGSIGAWLGMKVWRHKTMHKKPVPRHKRPSADRSICMCPILPWQERD